MEDTKIIVSERFKSLLSALNITVPELAKRLGYDRYDKLYNIYNAKYLPSFEILHDITKNFVGVNANWLLTGEGEILTNKIKKYNDPLEVNYSVSESNVEYKKPNDSVYYRLYKEEKEENKELLKQIGRLEEKLKIK